MRSKVSNIKPQPALPDRSVGTVALVLTSTVPLEVEFAIMINSARRVTAVGALVLASLAPVGARAPMDLDSATIADLNAAFAAGALTSEKLTQMYLAADRGLRPAGPSLRAVIAINPKAVETARTLDAERKTKGPRSPLHGIPVVLKDNFDTADMPTTGGSVLLEGSDAARRCVSGEEAASGGRDHRRQGQHVGIRLRRRAQLARRADPRIRTI